MTSCCCLEKHSLSTDATHEAPVDNERGAQIARSVRDGKSISLGPEQIPGFPVVSLDT